MRELKFRLWSKRTNRYITTCIVGGVEYNEISAFDLFGLRSDPQFQSDVIIEQYTGLKDKNGKEIYEGDILESTWNGDKAVVVWNNVEGEWEHYADFNTHSKYSGSVVIGNIHENPELLGEEEWS